VALVVPSSKKITRLRQLKGKTVGIPGFFGASFIGWKALLNASGLDEKDVHVKQIGFTQASAVQQDLVDAAVVYIVNEPIQLRNAGIDVHVFEVSDYIDLVSNGLIVGEKLMNKDPELVRSMVRATLRGMLYATANPDEAFEISRKRIPEMSDEDAPVQRQVMDASIALWKSDQPGISSKKAWQDSVQFMRKTGILEKPVDVNTLFTNRFIQPR
jgi:NitT/TauT family transport system substrate-binding protein